MNTDLTPNKLDVDEALRTAEHVREIKNYSSNFRHIVALADEVYRLRTYEAVATNALEACSWMHSDKSLGLLMGDRFTVEGVFALKKQRDELRAAAKS